MILRDGYRGNQVNRYLTGDVRCIELIPQQGRRRDANA